jgi:hypothetical protein
MGANVCTEEELAMFDDNLGEKFEGTLTDLDTVGAEYLPVPCNNPLCVCHIQYPFAILGFHGDDVLLLGRATTATGAMAGLNDLQQEVSREASKVDWEYKLSEGFRYILNVESAQQGVIQKTAKMHKEDLIQVPPGFESILSRGEK